MTILFIGSEAAICNAVLELYSALTFALPIAVYSMSFWIEAFEFSDQRSIHHRVKQI